MRRIIAMLFVLTASAQAQMPSGHVTGTVTFRERIALPSSAVVEVSLEDVSRADAVGRVVVATTIASPGQSPIQFDLVYETARLDAARRYGVRARIMDGRRVLFESSSPVLVVTQGHPNTANLGLTMVAGEMATPAPTAAVSAPGARSATSGPAPRLTNLPASFVGTHYQLNLYPDDSYFLRTTAPNRAEPPVDDMGSWVLSSDRRVVVLQGTRPKVFAIRDAFTLRALDADGLESGASDLRRSGSFQPLPVSLTMRGIYRPAVGGGRFLECSTGRDWLVERKPGDFEPRYRQASSKQDAPMLVTVAAHLILEPGLVSASTPMDVVFDRLITTSPGGTCDARFAAAPLEGTTWKLVRIGQTPVTGTRSSQMEPHLTFSARPRNFAGSGGCNRLAGGYDIDGSSLRLKAVGTLMACPGTTAAETAFRAALDRARTYRVAGRTLDLFGADGQLLARFEAKAQAL